MGISPEALRPGESETVGASDVTELGPVEEDGTPEIVYPELSVSVSLGDRRIDIRTVFSYILLNTTLGSDSDGIVLRCQRLRKVLPIEFLFARNLVDVY